MKNRLPRADDCLKNVNVRRVLFHIILPGAVFFSALAALCPASAQTWTQTSAPVTQWNCLASSADGTKLIAISGFNWNYCISTNSGSTWTTNTEPQAGGLNSTWQSIAVSADGTEYAGIVDNSVWVSTNSGVSWSSNNIVPTTSPLGILAMSADGKKLVAATGITTVGSSFIYTSTNSGVTWVQTSAPNKHWSSIACSADGNIIAAVASATPPSGSVYISTNAGSIWTQANTNSPASNNWNTVTISADGSRLVAGSFPYFLFDSHNNFIGEIPGLIYSSTNLGATWSSNNVPDNGWASIASSANGRTLVAGINIGGVYTSTNFGATWSKVPNLTNNAWISDVSSADGNKLAIASDFNNGTGGYGGIYTSQTTLSPQLNFSPTSTNFTLAWTVPSTNFVLQQSTDLVSWSVVTNPPVLNLTNLQNQVTLPSSNSSGFYRLKTP
jgi:hypothetical protein